MSSAATARMVLVANGPWSGRFIKILNTPEGRSPERSEGEKLSNISCIEFDRRLKGVIKYHLSGIRWEKKLAGSMRKRTMTDQEISIVKAMLSKGMRNDAIHFYFNRADRLLSSGRIAQIRKNKYGSTVVEASTDELDSYLADWHARQTTGENIGTISPVAPNIISAMFLEKDDVWTMHRGETDQTECKKSFRLNPDERFADVIRSIAGLANNKGGYIFFGVKDRTFTADGLSDAAFFETDPAQINRSLAGALDPVPHVTKSSITLGTKRVGVLYVEKHEHAPVIATKNIAQDVKEGTIYYRYVSETRAIKPGELRQIIVNREQRAIAEFTRRINRVAAGEEATIDLDTGEVTGKSGRFVIDQDLLPNIQFIREGDFSEVKGAPALRLIGEVEPISATERQRARVIRDNVTPDAVIRNFLRGEQVADPMQYIHSQAHSQRKWLPVWFYVKQSQTPLDEIIEDLRRQVATHPSSRDALVRRLLKTVSAYRKQTGKPAALAAKFLKGEIQPPKTTTDDSSFANAILGLTDEQGDLGVFQTLLLTCLDRAQGSDTKTGSRRSTIYRAACRLDELLNLPKVQSKTV